MHTEDTARSNGLTRRSFARIASVGVASAVLFMRSIPALASEGGKQRVFVDSLDRSVTVATIIENVTPVGVHAQTLMTTLCPEGLVSLAKNVDSDAVDYDEAGISELISLPETGGIASLATEEVTVQRIEAISPELILDVGFPKDGLAAELDALQAETGIPVFFLDISFGNLPSAYRVLGELLHCQERAEELAAYIEGVYSRVRAIAVGATTSCSVFYAPRKNGLMVRSGIEAQLDAISFVGATPITAPYDYANRTVNLEILDKSNADLVVFDDTECLSSLIDIEGQVNNGWQVVKAVLQGKFAISPALMHSWFGSPVLVQVLGVQWLAGIVWPSKYQFNMVTESNAFYSLFFGLNKDEQALTQLIGEYNETGYGNAQR